MHSSLVMCLADLAPAWISFQAIVPPWFNAYARTRMRNTLFRLSFVGVLGRLAPGQFWRETGRILRRTGTAAGVRTAISAPSRAALVLPSPCGFSPSC